MKPSQTGWTGGRAAAAIRPAHRSDLAALGDFFAGLSARTRYLRFFGPVTPGPALLRQLCGLAGTIDAMIAVRGAVIVGHAMAVDRTDPRGARVTDIGVVVADTWQGRGLGSALMRALVTRAQARGVTLLEMDVLYSNRRVIDMITSHWPAARVERSPDSISIRIRLQQHQQQQHHQSAYRPAPAGRDATGSLGVLTFHRLTRAGVASLVSRAATVKSSQPYLPPKPREAHTDPSSAAAAAQDLTAGGSDGLTRAPCRAAIPARNQG